TRWRLDAPAGRDAGAAQPPDDGLQVMVLSRRVEAAFGRPLLALLGDDARGMRTMAERDLDHFVGPGHLEVERQLELAHQALDIAVDDVAAVLAQIGGDAIGARRPGQPRGAQPVGPPAPRRGTD